MKDPVINSLSKKLVDDIYIEGDEFMSNTKIESDGNPT
jgi:hypothetical protein